MSVRYAVPPIVTNGLVLYLDAANRQSYVSGSTTWYDATSNGLSGSLTNGPTFDSGSLGSIKFDGVSSYITGSDSSNFAFGSGDFTVSYWMYINSLSGSNSTPTFVDLRSNLLGNSNGYADYIQNNKFKLYWNNADRYISTGSLVTGSWYNITSTRQSTTVSVYFNGVLDGISTDNTNLTESGFRLARNVNTSGTSYLNGRMASVLIYKGKALTAQEVQQNYNATKARYGL